MSNMHFLRICVVLKYANSIKNAAKFSHNRNLRQILRLRNCSSRLWRCPDGVYMYVCMSVFLTVCLSVCSFVSLFFCLSVRLSLCLFVCLFAFLSVYSMCCFLHYKKVSAKNVRLGFAIEGRTEESTKAWGGGEMKKMDGT